MYRREALEHHLRRHDERVLPRMVRPPVFRVLWMGCLVLAAAGALVAAARLPEFASGPGVVVAAAGGGVEMVALLPAAALPRLRPGQEVLFRSGEGVPPRRSTVLAVEPLPMGPDAVRARFGAAAARADGPAAVARVRFAVPVGEGVARHAGSVYQVDVPVGSRRLVSFARSPGAGR